DTSFGPCSVTSALKVTGTGSWTCAATLCAAGLGVGARIGGAASSCGAGGGAIGTDWTFLTGGAEGGVSPGGRAADLSTAVSLAGSETLGGAACGVAAAGSGAAGTSEGAACCGAASRIIGTALATPGGTAPSEEGAVLSSAATACGEASAGLAIASSTVVSPCFSSPALVAATKRPPVTPARQASGLSSSALLL